MSIQIGDFNVLPILDGTISFDAGVFFNIVPKPVWEKHVEVDAFNRITVGVNVLLIKNAHTGEKILIDAGVGIRPTDSQKKLYNLSGDNFLIKELEKLGILPEHITKVILTHLHFDKVGCLAYYPDNLRVIRPMFSHATHYVHRDEWDAAHATNDLSRILYKSVDYNVLFDSGLLNFVVHEKEEVVPGITIKKVGGHTRGFCIVIIASKGKKLFVLGDLVPTRHHVIPSWTSGFDYSSTEVVTIKTELLNSLAGTENLVFLSNEIPNPVGTIGFKDEKKVTYQFVSYDEQKNNTPNEY